MVDTLRPFGGASFDQWLMVSVLSFALKFCYPYFWFLASPFPVTRLEVRQYHFERYLKRFGLYHSHTTGWHSECLRRCLNTGRPSERYTPDRCRRACCHARFVLDRRHTSWGRGLESVDKMAQHILCWSSYSSCATSVAWAVHHQRVNIVTIWCHASWASRLVAVI